MFLRASPIDVSTLLQEKLFDKLETVVLTSATLSSNGKFDFIKDRLGLDTGDKKTETLLAPSAFDYQKQAIIYLPKAMPDPRAPEFSQMAAAEIVKLLQVTNGRAFVLSTSNFSMNTLYELVSMRVNFPCFVQGSMSKAGLLENFAKRRTLFCLQLRLLARRRCAGRTAFVCDNRQTAVCRPERPDCCGANPFY
jgi:ATP-dependent DNA helicase DinG